MPTDNELAARQLDVLRLVLRALASAGSPPPVATLAELLAADAVDADAILAAARRARAWKLAPVGGLGDSALRALSEDVDRAADQLEAGAPVHEVEIGAPRIEDDVFAPHENAVLGVLLGWGAVEPDAVAAARAHLDGAADRASAWRTPGDDCDR